MPTVAICALLELQTEEEVKSWVDPSENDPTARNWPVSPGDATVCEPGMMVMAVRVAVEETVPQPVVQALTVTVAVSPTDPPKPVAVAPISLTPGAMAVKHPGVAVVVP